MRKLRVTVIMHESLVPPENAAELPDEQFWEFKAEYDVLTGLAELGHEAEPLGLYDELAPLRKRLAEQRPHIVFNLLEEFKERQMFDQNVVGYLELQGVPYTGCNPRGLVIARDKALSKKILHYHRIPVPRFAVFRRGKRIKRPAALQFPLIVKTLDKEASVGIAEASVVHSDDKLAERVEFIHESINTDAIVEQYIEGKEIYMGVLGNERLQVLPPWELNLESLRDDAPKIATRKVKWNLAFQERRGVKIGPAAGLSEEVHQRLVRTTKRLYRALNLSGYARIDFRVDGEGKPYFLEANPNADISYGEEFSSAAEAAGLDYHALLQKVLRLGLRSLQGP